ncbi:lactonase family protein [Microbacterium sp. P5_E9]
MRFWVGGYTAESGGAATGIGVLLAGAADDALAGGQLAVATDAATTAGSPSWLTLHPTLDVLYAALEAGQAVQAFRRSGEASFVPLGAPIPTGEANCHVAVAPDGGSLVAGCWGDGRVVHMTLDAAGRPSAPVIAESAVDPYGPASDPYGLGADPFGLAVTLSPAVDVDLVAATRALRAAAGEEYAHLIPDHDAAPEVEPGADAGDEASRPSRAHQSVFLPGGLVATTDMGLDLVRFWRSGRGGLRALQQVVLPQGSGPRHMVWHPSGHLYVVTELSHEIFALAADQAGSWRIVGGTTLGGGILPDDTAAELAASADGFFLYAGVRGSDTIATVQVRGEGESLAPVALVEAGVHWPRHHVIARDTLLVAGQLSNDVVSLGLDTRTGVPGRVRHRVDVPSPTCLVRAR